MNPGARMGGTRDTSLIRHPELARDPPRSGTCFAARPYRLRRIQQGRDVSLSLNMTVGDESRY